MQEGATVQTWFAAMTKRGHASMFARPSNAEKCIVECQTAEEWARSVAAEGGSAVTEISSCSSDPPDCVGLRDGLPIKIELAELLHGNALHRVDVARRKGLAGLSFDELQWNDTLFRERVNAILNRKQEKLASANLTIDALVIHTDEPWLSPHQMRIWTPTEAFARRSNITTAYLLRTYVPNYAAHWPVFKIY